MDISITTRTEIIIFIVYLLFMLAIGLYFFIKGKSSSEKTYFLGGRKMGAWVTALSAGASDMSAWVLMGLPASIYALGLGQVWIPIGLALGYALSWIFMAPRLRRFSIVANDSITIPQYLSNRFLSKSKALRVICAIIFLVAYTVYAASSVYACGKLFHTVIGIDEKIAMIISAAIIIGYTFLGGYSAVCWTDFFQGLLILGAMLIAPIFAYFALDTANGLPDITAATPEIKENYWNLFTNWKDIVSGLAWGFGYFGMPHIIIRFMSLKSQKDLKKSAKIGISWTVLIVIFAALIGIIGNMFIGYSSEIKANETVFVEMVRRIFPAVVSGILLSAVLAASMSTADSQLLAASSAFTSDVYKPLIRGNKSSDKELLRVGQCVVVVIALLALVIALLPNTGTIMSLVSNAWGIFGAAFGPTLLLSLFWKRFNIGGAIAGIVGGGVIDVLWLLFLSGIGIYELFPGFVGGLIIAVIVTLITKKPSAEVEKLFDDSVNYSED